ncbi:TspO/MBR family protein [Sphingosinicella soli]|uniref:Tryptophan-rich sensory protein n=1 Tax=Sphingosinicella soli TaxID=333708 RepID=A0A7W7AYA4_9SPHN|nr:TspO/MBR family protein [Sphingosinicella soli]MBB4630616.1 tryptophan-rich sensory protein [Sphingosinicella soli]
MSLPRSLRIAILTVPGVMLLGSLSGVVAGSGETNPWFATLVKPALYPPGFVFGIVWTLLYALMGIAIARVLACPPERDRQRAALLFAAQLVLNLLWSTLFFKLHLLGPSFALILVILAAALATTLAFARLDRIAPWLLVPYLAWLCFAAGLAFRIWRLNPGAAPPY